MGDLDAETIEMVCDKMDNFSNTTTFQRIIPVLSIFWIGVCRMKLYLGQLAQLYWQNM
jgi:hypothetical protein